jgi:hypothetical protein
LCLAAGAAAACTVGYLYVRVEAGGAALIDWRLLIFDAILLAAAAFALAREVLRRKRRHHRSRQPTSTQRPKD